MVASSASCEGNSKRDSGSVLFDLSESSNKSPDPLLDGPATSEHMIALLPFKFPASGKYDAMLDSYVSTTPTMHVRAAKALFEIIMHKVYCQGWSQKIQKEGAEGVLARRQVSLNQMTFVYKESSKNIILDDAYCLIPLKIRFVAIFWIKSTNIKKGGKGGGGGEGLAPKSAFGCLNHAQIGPFGSYILIVLLIKYGLRCFLTARRRRTQEERFE